MVTLTKAYRKKIERRFWWVTTIAGWIGNVICVMAAILLFDLFIYPFIPWD